MFLQYSQEIVLKSLLGQGWIKVAGLNTCNFIKRDSNSFFLWILQYFPVLKNILIQLLENNKRFLGKATSHNDHYMIFMGSQRPKIGGNWLLTGLYLQNWNRETVFSCQEFHHTNIVQLVPPYHIISNVHICFFTLLSPLGWCPKLLLGIVTSHKNKHAGLLVLHLLLLLNLCSLLKCGQLKSFLSVLLWYSAELTQLVSLPFSCGRSTCYSNRLHDFFVTIPWCYKDVYVNSFPCTARLWNSHPIECFPLTHNLNVFKSRINKHLLTAGSL